jgi:hypothetical protein
MYDGGDIYMTASWIRDEFLSPVHIKTPGYALYKKEGYGNFLGKGIEDIKNARHKIDRCK